MIADEIVLRNIREARDNGFDLVCAECGVGMRDEDFEEPNSHEMNCPNEGRDRAAEWATFLAERGNIGSGGGD